MNFQCANEKKQTSVKAIINKDGEKLTKPDDKADCFNEHFGTVGENMAKEHDKENGIHKNPLEYITKEPKESLFLHNVDDAEILTLISKLQLKKACGYDQISNRILKATSFTSS